MVRASYGDVRVTSGGKLVLIGYARELTVESGGYALIIGMVERLVVKPGGRAKHRGYCRGDATDEGGDLTVTRGAVIEGTLHGRSITHVMPGARFGPLRP